MALKTTDRWLAPSRGTVDDVMRFAGNVGSVRQLFLRDYAEEMKRLCGTYGFDYALPMSHSAVETGDPARGGGWLSPAWEDWGNPIGLGITDGGLDIIVYQNGTDAARAHFVHLWLYVKGEIPRGHELEPWIALDPRYDDAIRAGYAGIATTLADLQERWWTNDDGTAAVVSRGNALFPGIPDQRPTGNQGETPVNRYPTEPNVNRPTIYLLTEDYGRFGISRDQMLTVRGNKFEGRWGARPVSVFCHVQDGVTRGSLEHWSIVDASSTVMIQRDGSILQVIDEDDGPWTNGDVNAPLQEAAWLIALGGNVNNWSLTIEAEADASNVLTAAEEDAVVWQIEDWALRYPEIMQRLIQATFGHYAVNSVSRAFCGRYVARIDERLTTWLANAGTTPEPKPAPEPVSLYPADMTPQLAKRFYELKGPLTFSWTSKAIGFDDTRSEVQAWLIRGAASIPEGGDWSQGRWPYLVDVVRRGRSNNVHVYQYSDGSVYPKIVRRDALAEAA